MQRKSAGQTFEGYLMVHNQLWDYLPPGSHIKYYKKDPASPKAANYRPGGYVKSHMAQGNRKMLLLENRPGGPKGKNDTEYTSFLVSFDEIEELWKKYDRNAMIEIYLIRNSLAQKDSQIQKLEERVAALENIIKTFARK